jgi:hypothetical protein
MEAEAEEKRRLTVQTLQLDPGPTQEPLVGPQSSPKKREDDDVQAEDQAYAQTPQTGL